MLSTGSLCCSIHRTTSAQGLVASWQQCNKEHAASRHLVSNKTHRWGKSDDWWQRDVKAKQNEARLRQPWCARPLAQERKGALARSAFLGVAPVKSFARHPSLGRPRRTNKRCAGGAATASATIDSYRAEDFEILQPVGRLTVQETWTMSREEMLASEDEDSDEEDEEDLIVSAPSFINVYAARFATGKPMGMKDEKVYLKEYTPAARELAMREIKVYERLQDTGLGNAIGMTDTGELPVPKLVGRFVAGGLDAAWGPDGEDDEFDIRGVVVEDRSGRQYYVEMEEPDDMSSDEDDSDNDHDEAVPERPMNIDLAKLGRRRELEGFGSVSQGSMFLSADGKVTDTYEEGNVSLETAEDEGARLWLVFEFEGMCTMEDFPGIEQPPNVVDFFRRGAAQERLTRFVKAVIRGAVEAMAFCHVRGVVHNAIAGSCFLLSTYEAKDWDKVRVKLSNFGFASDLSMGIESLDKEIQEMCRSLGADSPMAIASMCRQHDIRMLGLAIAEFVFSTLGKSEVPANAASIQRLWDGVYELNIEAIRNYYLEDEDFKDVVDFLDVGEKAGWELLELLLSWTGTEADRVLSEARFFNPPGGWKLR
ncbi:hypothetical protein KFL_000300460 [Klebsormidium nitens]|uniref:Protein kinase domain-containing protein n=1 Tax=Klebsormidium nitens TaxID=105231 RepID=A0A0U9HQU9_KLENI|nr:hypothetical protein KFL_000300460 [Klebsormidium nitens]|eukprot:GAQ79448.1 hypothetical protein KFL_000300460 [Klebsormidium nitens]